MAAKTKAAKIYINGRLIGFHENPEKLTQEMIKARRSNKISHQVNIAFHEDTNELYINTDAGRLQRPLIVVENGKMKITEEHLKSVAEGKMSWDDLIKEGLIEYLDPEEEENTLIAINTAELTKEHTHVEINPLAILSLITSMIPYVQHDMAGKALHGAKMFKQSLGISGINYNRRFDTESYMLHYSQKSLVNTKTMNLIELDKRPETQNLVVAIVPYRIFNTLDALVLNQGSVERGMGRNSYYRTYEASENRYPGGQADRFELPNDETVGYLGEEAYKTVGEDGLVNLEQYVGDKQIVVGRTSPPRFLEEISEFGVVKEKRRDSSVSSRKGKPGFVDKVMITESEEGNKLAKIKLRTTMLPEVGDKFSSRHGQKGVIGAIVPEADMPFTIDGIKPDLIINPHSIPSRMTMGHLLEMLGGKVSSLKGEEIDGTPFNSMPQKEL